MVPLAVEFGVRQKVEALAELAPRIGAGSLADYIAPEVLHRGLNAFDRARLQPTVPSEEWQADLAMVHAVERIEARFVEEERMGTRAQLSLMPRTVPEFLNWFAGLKETGPGQYDPFFDYLAQEASREDLHYFIKQEYCGEIGFDDLIALTQVRLPQRAKLELARNFWDEQGQGKAEDMHGPLYTEMAHELGVGETDDREFLWETLAVANLLTALAYNRRYAWHSLGALSIIELTSPTRASRVAQGLERVGVSDAGCRYFRMHTVVDVEHWKAWLAEVIIPLVSETPDLMLPLAEGALLRLNAGARVIDRYRSELRLDARWMAKGTRATGVTINRGSC
jgi:pyrroloquinoline quinone (PQQ) biosynthesis protein C